MTRSIQMTAAALLALSLGACTDMGMSGGPVANANAVGTELGTGDTICDRPNEPTGTIVDTGTGTTAVIDTGAGSTSPANPDC